MRLLLGVTFAWSLLACGSENIASSSAEPTSEQRAQQLMNDGDYAGAIEILAPLVADEPEVYGRMPLLAAAYAGAAGIDLFAVLESQIGSSGEGSIFNQVFQFLPAEIGSDNLDRMELSIATLEAIPANQRGSEGDPEFGESAEFQLVLYQSLYSTMLLGQYVDVDLDGSLNPSDLDSMSDAEVAALFDSLEQASQNGTSGQSAEVSGQADQTLADIGASEGSSDRERLQNYLGNQ